MNDPAGGFSTRAVHGSGAAPEGPVARPIAPASTYRFKTIAELSEANAGRVRHDEFYSRYGNPNLKNLEERIATLDGAERSLAFSSGMAAIAAVGFGLLRPGARVAVQQEIYGGALTFFRDVLAPWGVEATFINMNDRAGFERACSGGVDLIYIETPANPLCRIADVRAFAALARAARAPLACDATFASPYNQNTVALGADIVIQSATKYLGGHSDLLGGAVSGRGAFLDRIEIFRKRTGSVPDPEQAWRIERSLKTLALRVERQNHSALAVAQYLSNRPEIENVYYPGLRSHPDHALAKQQMRGFGGVLAFDVRGGEPAARRFAEALSVISIAPSLGSVESLISPPIHTSHASMSPEERRRAGIADGSLRLSIGVEDVNDLIADINKGLAAAREQR